MPLQNQGPSRTPRLQDCVGDAKERGGGAVGPAAGGEGVHDDTAKATQRHSGGCSRGQAAVKKAARSPPRSEERASEGVARQRRGTRGSKDEQARQQR